MSEEAPADEPDDEKILYLTIDEVIDLADLVVKSMKGPEVQFVLIEDANSEALVAFFDAVKDFDPKRNPNFKARAYTRGRKAVLRNVIWGQAPQNDHADLDDPATVAELPVKADHAERVAMRADCQAFLATLTPLEQLIVGLVLYEDRSQAEAACVTGLHPRTVSRLLARVEKKGKAFFNVDYLAA